MNEYRVGDSDEALIVDAFTRKKRTGGVWRYLDQIEFSISRRQL